MDEAQLAAEHFIWQVMAIPVNRAMFTGEDGFLAAELDRYPDEAVRVFIAALSRPRSFHQSTKPAVAA
jgi:TetR/AcrR family transcriptional repressor of mexJK operon